jgi:hypothetical protein
LLTSLTKWTSTTRLAIRGQLESPSLLPGATLPLILMELITFGLLVDTTPAWS